MNDSEYKIVEYIKECQAQNQRPPTHREIMLEMGWASPRAVSFHVEHLIEDGHLVKKPGSRGLFLPAEVKP